MGDPMAVWNKYGLAPARLWRGRAVDPRYSSLPRATRFRLALDELGGLFVLYGFYLSGRADLLQNPHLRQLRKIRLSRVSSARPALNGHLAGRLSDVRALRLSPAAELFSGRFGDRPVVVEIYGGGAVEYNDKDWAAFRKEIRCLQDGPEHRITQRQAIDRFREWVGLAADLERRRSMLSNLETVPAGCISRFPRLVPELQETGCLAYEGTAATPLPEAMEPEAPEGAKRLQILIEALLEQSLLLSVLDAEGSLDHFSIGSDGSFCFASLPVLAPVPVEWHYELLQYTASSVAGDSPRALRMLSRMCSKQDPYAGEQRLMRELSGLQPELKINIVTPESVASLENSWRALSNTRMRPPLFLELFHRQWTLVGQYNGEIAPAADLIAESLWPVIGRILRYRLGDILTAEKGREWIVNSGLMLLTAARQTAMLVEQGRDNDLALIVDRQEDEPSDARLNRRTLSLVRSTLTLGVFLLSAYVALNAAGGAVQLAAAAATAVSAVILAIFVARID